MNMVKINGRKVGGGARNTTEAEAKNTFKREKRGQEVSAKDKRDARRTAADHYATEADRANRENGR
jgi:hypothetical protein